MAQSHVDVHIDGSDCIVRVRGELDIYTTPAFKEALNKALGSPRIIIDLTGCRYIDSSVIAALIQARRDSASTISLVVTDGMMVRRVLDITQMEKLIPIVSSLEEAKRLA